VLVSARKLSELGVVEGELEQPRPIEETVRPLSAPELFVEAGPELVPPPSLEPDPAGQTPLLGGRAFSAAG
jgi:hypothetical protein